jgi:hypothetical protein
MLQLNKQDNAIASAAATSAPNSAPDGAGNPPAGTEFDFQCFNYKTVLQIVLKIRQLERSSIFINPSITTRRDFRKNSFAGTDIR